MAFPVFYWVKFDFEGMESREWMNGQQINVLHSAKYAFIYDVLVFALLIVTGPEQRLWLIEGCTFIKGVHM